MSNCQYTDGFRVKILARKDENYRYEVTDMNNDKGRKPTLRTFTLTVNPETKKGLAVMGDGVTNLGMASRLWDAIEIYCNYTRINLVKTFEEFVQ